MIANLIDIDSFTGRYILPIVTGTEDVLDAIITEVQYDTLINLMGYPIYKEFEDGLAVTPPPPIEQKWLDLRDGAQYTDCYGDLNNWQGLAYMLVPFAWSAYIQSDQYKASQIGLNSSAPKNSVLVNDFKWARKIHNIQNEGITRYREAYLFMYSNLIDYNDFTTFYQEQYFNQVITKRSIK